MAYIQYTPVSGHGIVCNKMKKKWKPCTLMPFKKKKMSTERQSMGFLLQLFDINNKELKSNIKSNTTLK